MSMGGGSDDVRPIRSYGSRPAYSTGGDEPSAAGRAAETPRAEAADYSLPTYVGVGGGLSNRRIIKKMPQDLQGETPYESNLVKVIKYMISPEVAATDQDQVVEQAVRERIELSDCRLLINNPAGLEPPYNLGKEHLQDTLGTYLVKKHKEQEQAVLRLTTQILLL